MKRIKKTKKVCIELVREILLFHSRRFAEEVAPIYKALNWEWFDTGVPTEDDICSVTSRLINDLEGEGKESSIETGGLKVYYEIEGDNIILGLKFEKGIERIFSKKHFVK